MYIYICVCEAVKTMCPPGKMCSFGEMLQNMYFNSKTCVSN